MTVGQDGQLHKVICKRCKTVLQDGINPPVKKLCMDCVRKTYPAAPGGLRDPNGKRIGQEKPHEEKISIETEMYTLEPEDETKETIVIIHFKIWDYFKDLIAEFTVNYDQMTEMYNEMTKLHLEHNK
jgi:hypothetical protein